MLMQKLRAGTLGDKVLVVATEVAARGIDIPGQSRCSLSFELEAATL